ncbi:hypothetical protein ASPFODRAFT_361796 [Aspergillus luchuensis CBS 106.47]|uniref:Uncharacterized protein n=1 Tax=Aspergillus luchuensis (strain CBS 106.47) TaxID=1137211 RepID=A0A1M3T4Y0_ASPLC|nr:hypothetical protein ASPFODRAFT_361796 [Aspergillus luchuensis CBS 106.47]
MALNTYYYVLTESHCNSSPAYPIPHASGRNRAERIKPDLAHSRNTSSFQNPHRGMHENFFDIVCMSLSHPFHRIIVSLFSYCRTMSRERSLFWAGRKSILHLKEGGSKRLRLRLCCVCNNTHNLQVRSRPNQVVSTEGKRSHDSKENLY